MKSLALFLLITSTAYSQNVTDTLPTLIFFFNDGTVVSKPIFKKINENGQEILYVNSLTNKQIESFDSLIVKDYFLEYFGGYSADCGDDYWFNSLTSFSKLQLEYIRRHSLGCKEVGFSLKIINLESKKRSFLKEICIYSYRKIK